MPNLYATLDDMRDSAVNAIRDENIDYDQSFLRLSDAISRLIDGYCGRVFYPALATKTFDGNGQRSLWIPDLISVTSISYSLDDGQNYTALTASDYDLTSGESYNPTETYNRVELDVNGTLGNFPTGHRSIQIVGAWGYNDDRARAFEDSLDSVQSNPLASDSLEVTVTDIHGPNQWGLRPRFSPGNLIRIESEYIEITTTNKAAKSAVIVRGVNGTTAAAHVQNVQIDNYRVPPVIRQAAIAQAIHTFNRAQAGFGDAEERPTLGKVIHVKALDPTVTAMLERAGMVKLKLEESF